MNSCRLIYLLWFVDVATSEFLEMVENLIKVSETHGITLKCVEDFHVSLSRTLKLRHHWIQSFIDSLKGHLSHLIKYVVYFIYVKYFLL